MNEPSRGLEGSESQLDDYIDPGAERRVIRKLDICIGIPIGILFLLSYLDRSNLGNAFSAGLATDLKLPANGINVSTSIFYVTYVLFEIPSAMLFKRIGARKIIPFITVMWGLCTLFTGFVTNYASLIATRLVLGAAESGFFPILSVYLSIFYRREELGQRTSYLFVSAAISGAFGGILAFGIFHMDGIGGKTGWAWLYIIEGILTTVCGFASYWVLADDFENAWYLNEDDKRIMRLRAKAAQDYQGDGEFSWSEAGTAFKDPKVWMSGLAQMFADTALFALSTFLPVIVRTFNKNYTTIIIQLLTVPIYAFASISYILVASLTDRVGKRGIVLPITALLVSVGYIILLTASNSGARYFACFLAGMMVGLNVSFLNVNNAPSLKRATAAGLQLTLGNSGGIISGQIFRSSNAPKYTLGYAVSLAFCLAAGVLYILFTLYLSGMNQARDRAQQLREGTSGEGSATQALDSGHGASVGVKGEDAQATSSLAIKVRRSFLRTGTGAEKDFGDRKLDFRYYL
ncbi:MFS general substrate transporter [Violaceomyces palustris]|uniref:MFS general substrate transporter n=1 Tax=Violaceomyces palustris TaxID=1673888 RepID=A0ACD0P6Q3_9BASI|nr:MFS general substrate transporter [Violaceomyces palustris]